MKRLSPLGSLIYINTWKVGEERFYQERCVLIAVIVCLLLQVGCEAPIAPRITYLYQYLEKGERKDFIKKDADHAAGVTDVGDDVREREGG